jgi:hypothetical protein
MSLKALITTLVLAATSTAALADPMPRDHREPTAQLDRRAPTSDMVFHKRPVVISSSTSLARGRDVINTNAKVRSLELVALKGATKIGAVTIKFANGTSQKLLLDRTLAPNAPLTIDVQGGTRNVVGIVFSGTSTRRASFEVLGNA